jgi:hypothetical protein
MDIIKHLDLIRASLLQPWTIYTDDILFHRRRRRQLEAKMRSNNE